MNMTRRKIYSKVSWRKYLDPKSHPRVNKFLKKNGTLVFNQIIECIQEASKTNQREIAILVHPNVQSVVMIEDTEYDEVLNHCLTYFKRKELYETCGTIVKLKNELNKETIKESEIL